MTAALAKTKTQTSQQEIVRVATAVATKSGLTIMTGAAALIGIWSVACLVAAVVNGNGPLTLMQGWLSAFTGQ